MKVLINLQIFLKYKSLLPSGQADRHGSVAVSKGHKLCIQTCFLQIKRDTLL